jgi:SAM-dependent methyltransferase
MADIKQVFARKQHFWEQKWSNANFNPHWGGRGVSKEIIEARRNGWLAPKGNVLDIGCGDGLLTTWFSEQGYQSLGFDLSPAAIQIAREKCRHLRTPPRFIAMDICRQQIPGGPYNIIIDRGCLHQIPAPGINLYKKNLVSVASADARFVLICAAYRGKNPVGDPVEQQRLSAWVQKTFAGLFALEKTEDTYLDRYCGENPAEAKGGIIFWLRRF